MCPSLSHPAFHVSRVSSHLCLACHTKHGTQILCLGISVSVMVRPRRDTGFVLIHVVLDHANILLLCAPAHRFLALIEETSVRHSSQTVNASWFAAVPTHRTQRCRDTQTQRHAPFCVSGEGESHLPVCPMRSLCWSSAIFADGEVRPVLFRITSCFLLRDLQLRKLLGMF